MVSKASSIMLEKATDDDVAGFQYCTIRNLDNKLSTQSDIKQLAVEHQRGSTDRNILMSCAFRYYFLKEKYHDVVWCT